MHFVLNEIQYPRSGVLIAFETILGLRGPVPGFLLCKHYTLYDIHNERPDFNIPEDTDNVYPVILLWIICVA